MEQRWRVISCTTDKLEQRLEQYASAPGSVLSCIHLGGRDWVLVVRRDHETVDGRARALRSGEVAAPQDVDYHASVDADGVRRTRVPPAVVSNEVRRYRRIAVDLIRNAFNAEHVAARVTLDKVEIAMLAEVAVETLASSDMLGHPLAPWLTQ